MRVHPKTLIETRTSGPRYPPQLSKDQNLEVRGEGTGTRPDYLVNRDDQKNEGPFGEKNCTEIEKSL